VPRMIVAKGFTGDPMWSPNHRYFIILK
jgi:hypothetical protein